MKIPESVVTLHERVAGSGEIIVMLHGLFGSHENLGGISRRLQPHFKVHALDLRNHGRSPHTASHTYPELAADVLAHIAQLTDGRVHVVGHSMGGKTAMQMALIAPERLASLTVIDIAPKRYPRHHDTILNALRALNDDPPPSRQVADDRLSADVPTLSTRQFLLKNLARNDSGEYGLRLNINTLIAHYDDIAAWPDSNAVCDVPTRFVVGGASDYVAQADRPTIAAQFPQATGEVIPGGSHWVHAEKPDHVSDLIRAFVQGQTPIDG